MQVLSKHTMWRGLVHLPGSPAISTPTPPNLMPPPKKQQVDENIPPVMVLDTNAASLNGILLGGSKKDEVLAIYPSWCDILRQYNMNLNSFIETRRAM